MFLIILNYAIICIIFALTFFAIQDLINTRRLDMMPHIILLAVGACGITVSIASFISTGEEKKEIENIKTVDWYKTSFRLKCEHDRVVYMNDFNKIKKFSEKYNLPTPENETYTRNLVDGTIVIQVEHTSYRNMNGSRSYEENTKFVESLEKWEK